MQQKGLSSHGARGALISLVVAVPYIRNRRDSCIGVCFLPFPEFHCGIQPGTASSTASSPCHRLPDTRSRHSGKSDYIVHTLPTIQAHCN